MSMSCGEARRLRIEAALGAHLIADSYRDTFPDSSEDAKYLRKQETFWRLKARQWLTDSDEDRCHQKAKERRACEPDFKSEMQEIRKRIKAAQPEEEAE
jgi:hypothetical protein